MTERPIANSRANYFESPFGTQRYLDIELDPAATWQSIPATPVEEWVLMLETIKGRDNGKDRVGWRKYRRFAAAGSNPLICRSLYGGGVAPFRRPSKNDRSLNVCLPGVGLNLVGEQYDEARDIWQARVNRN